MRILLTGCAGFIGSHLTERLLTEGHEVIGIDNFDPFYDRAVKQRNLILANQSTTFRLVEADITDPATWEKLHEVDVVCHMAAKAGVRPSIDNPEAYTWVNVLGTLNVLEWMRKGNCNKLVLASSSSVYGDRTQVPFKEDDPIENIISPYAFTKRSAELLTNTYHNLYGIDVINLRLFTAYGPRQRPDLAIHKFTWLISQGKEIPLYGDGTTGRDYTYVEDVVDGIYGATRYILSNENMNETINIGGSKPILLRDLVRNMGTAFGKEIRVRHEPMQPGDVAITFADTSKARITLGFEASISLQEGLKRFWEWYQRQLKELP